MKCAPVRLPLYGICSQSPGSTHKAQYRGLLANLLPQIAQNLADERKGGIRILQWLQFPHLLHAAHTLTLSMLVQYAWLVADEGLQLQSVKLHLH